MKKLLLALVIAFICLSPFIGDISFNDLLYSQTGRFVLNNIRIPKTIMAVLVGSSLAVAGWVFQILFRNPLATPYTLGVSAIAAFSVALSELLLQSHFVSNRLLVFVLSYIPFILFLGYGFIRQISRQQLLLIGVSVGIFSSSAIIFIQSILGNESVSRLIRWMMGSLEVVGYNDFVYLVPIVFIGLTLVWIFRKQLVLISIGEVFSQSRGIDVNRTTFILVLVINVLVGSIVWFCGPIGFVGLIIPHFVRGWYSTDFSSGFFPTIIIGAGFLVFADLLTRVLYQSHIISIGAITAIIGAPLLVYKVIKR